MDDERTTTDAAHGNVIWRFTGNIEHFRRVADVAIWQSPPMPVSLIHLIRHALNSLIFCRGPVHDLLKLHPGALAFVFELCRI